MIKFVRIASVILLISWMAMIFCLSHQTADESSKMSGVIIETAIKLMEPEFDSLSEEQQEALIASFQFVVRKLAHFSIFAILGLLSFISIGTYRISMFAKFFFSSLISLLYSISDEYHQLYIDGRSSELRDILIDFCGSLIAILFIMIIVRLNKKGLMNKLFYGGETMDTNNLEILNSELTKQLELSDQAVCQLQEENSELKVAIEQLKAKIDAIVTPETVAVIEESNKLSIDASTQTNSNNEEAAKEITLLTEDMDFGATVIGKIVVSAAKHCNNITAQGSHDTVKELVNLILGRTEVAKADILNIVSSDNSLEEKKELIEKERIYAEDYFCSVLGQKE